MGMPEADEMATLYAQCRLTGVKTRVLSNGFNGSSTAGYYCGTRGAICHDPTQAVFTTAPAGGYADLVMLPSSRLLGSGGFGNSSWVNLNYRAPCVRTMDMSETDNPSAGVWINSVNRTALWGRTLYAMETVDGTTNSSLNQEVLTILTQVTTEWRQPRPADDTMRTRRVTMSYFPHTEQEEKKQQPVARPPYQPGLDEEYTLVKPVLRRAPTPVVRSNGKAEGKST